MRYGAGHYMDVGYQFHNFVTDGLVPSAREIALADTLMQTWVRFAATGDPIGPGMPSWPRYTAGSDFTQLLDSSITNNNGFRSADCDFWDQP